MTSLLPLDRAALTPVVRRVLDEPSAEVVDWDAAPLNYAHANPATAGILRVAGAARVGSDAIPWSVVLKRLQPFPEDFRTRAMEEYLLTPADLHVLEMAQLWNREALLYRSGLLDALDGGLRAPRCFGVQMSDALAWLWLEDAGQSPQDPWPLARFHTVARHLGQFNGGFLTGRPMPAYEWLSRDWLRGWLVHTFGPHAVAHIGRAELWEQPAVRRAYPEPVVARLQRLWACRDVLFSALGGLPQTFCHHDALPQNLLPRTSRGGLEETVAVDWAFAGIGAIGEEIGQLLAATLLQTELDPQASTELEQVIAQGYLDGLRDAGWSGSPGLVRLGMTATASLRWALFAPRLHVESGSYHDGIPELPRGSPAEEIIARRAAITYYLLDRADEAFELAAGL